MNNKWILDSNDIYHNTSDISEIWIMKTQDHWEIRCRKIRQAYDDYFTLVRFPKMDKSEIIDEGEANLYFHKCIVETFGSDNLVTWDEENLYLLNK